MRRRTGAGEVGAWTVPPEMYVYRFCSYARAPREQQENASKKDHREAGVKVDIDIGEEGRVAGRKNSD